MTNHSTPIAYSYRDSGDWYEFSIRAGRRGWIIDRQSRVPGEYTGRVRLVYYSDEFPAGARLAAPYNGYHPTLGSVLAAWAEELPGRTLRVGQKVF